MQSELLKKAMAAKSPEELIKTAEENGLKLNAADAEMYFNRLHGESGEISDSEIESAAGGCGEGPKGWKCPLCGKDTYSYGLGVVKGAIPNNPYASSYEDLYICKKHKDYLFFRKYGAAVGVLDYRRFSEVQIIEVYHAYGGF